MLDQSLADGDRESEFNDLERSQNSIGLQHDLNMDPLGGSLRKPDR